jgi:predicted O-methyltransferase YrrM
MEDPAQLLLRYSGKVDFDIKFAIQQIQARQKAKSKIPSWYNRKDLLFPVNLSLEQASSEETAKFKASILKGNSMVDLTGGMGIDAFFIGQNFTKIVYCERNEELFTITNYNLEKLNPSTFECILGDSMAWLEATSTIFDWIFIDPARRGTSNQKLYKLSDCEPNVVAYADILGQKGRQFMIKASPMLDIKQALKELPQIHQVIVVDVKNEVKEILLIGGKKEVSSTVQLSCVSLHPSFQNNIRQFDFTFEEEENASACIGAAERYLIEPQSSILKAGAFQIFAHRYGLKKLHANTHLYSHSKFPRNVAGRIFEIIEEIKQPKRELKSLVLDGKINVITRNYSLSAEELKKKFKLKDGGDHFLIGGKDGASFKLWLCKLVHSPEA